MGIGAVVARAEDKEMTGPNPVYSAAKALWSFQARELQQPEFQAKFDEVYRHAIEETNIEALWQLGGAANDYIRSRPQNNLIVPNELAPTLLSSKLMDARIIGLKLLTRCSPNIELVADWICRALVSKHECEVYGGLSELGKLLESRNPFAKKEQDEICSRLRDLHSSPDPYLRDASCRLADWIAEQATIGPAVIEASN